MTAISAYPITLDNVMYEIRQLSYMAEQALIASMRAFATHDAEMARRINNADVELNTVRFTIEDSCYTLLNDHNFTPKQMRAIVGSITVAISLERMGDYAAGIAFATTKLLSSANGTEIEIPNGIAMMGQVAREMLADSVSAYLVEDHLAAESVVRRDREIDDLSERVYEQLAVAMTNQICTVEQVMLLLMMVRNLERIGDHAVNICERTIFVSTGELKEFR